MGTKKQPKKSGELSWPQIQALLNEEYTLLWIETFGHRDSPGVPITDEQYARKLEVDRLLADYAHRTDVMQTRATHTARRVAELDRRVSISIKPPPQLPSIAVLEELKDLSVDSYKYVASLVREVAELRKEVEHLEKRAHPTPHGHTCGGGQLCPWSRFGIPR